MSPRRHDSRTHPPGDPPALVPRPKQVTFSEVGFVVGRALSVEGHEPLAHRAQADLRSFFAQAFGVDVADTRNGTREPAFAFARTTDAAWPAEGYRLSVSPAGVRIEADDERGFLHAVQTVKQLAVRDPDNQVVIRGAEIFDWPSLRFRGVHMFTGGQGADLHIRLIRNVIGALKMNHLVLESEYVEWDSHPEIHHPEYGMPKAEVRRVINACRDLGLDVTPLVMSLGHCQWMFTNDRNLDLAEDPEAKWAYCVTNPRTYDFVFEVYAEALELFQSRWFHVGHDEFTQRGRYPFREASRRHSAAELLMMDTRRLHAWLGNRGVRMMMWGDMLLAEGEGPDACHASSAESAAALRAELPDDVLIADWHYAERAPEDFTSLSRFHDGGHETLAASWYRPNNIVNYARAAYACGSLGLLQTTWAGDSLDPQSLQRELHQYAAYVLAADAAWNADDPRGVDASSAETRFLELMGLSPPKPDDRVGWAT